MYQFHNRSMICLSLWKELSFLFYITERVLNATELYKPSERQTAISLSPMVRQRVILKETFHYLHAPSIGTLAAHDVFDCTFECLSNPLCSSLNLASSNRADGTLWCEFLSSDRYRNPKEYRRNQSSHHLYFKVNIIVGVFSWTFLFIFLAHFYYRYWQYHSVKYTYTPVKSQ